MRANDVNFYLVFVGVTSNENNFQGLAGVSMCTTAEFAHAKLNMESNLNTPGGRMEGLCYEVTLYHQQA